MLVFSFVSYRNVQKFQTTLEEQQANLFVLHSAAQADTLQQTLRATVLSLLISPVPAENDTLQRTQQQVTEYTAAFHAALTNIERQTTSQQRQTVVAELHFLSSEYGTTAKEIVALIATGQRTSLQSLLGQLQEQTQQLSSQLAQFTLSVQTEVTATTNLGDQTVAGTKRTFLWLLILGPAIAILVTVLVVRSITHPLEEMTTAAKRIARGDIDQTLRYQATDESGIHAAAFRDLIVYLKRIAEAAESISKGDLSVHVTPVSDRDLLSHSFLRMVSNLRTLNSQVQQS